MKDKLKNSWELTSKSQLTKAVLLIVNCLLLTFFLFSCNSDKEKNIEANDTAHVYYCPMDTDVVVQKEPGICPKCKMDLIKKEDGKKETVYYCPMCPGQEQNKAGVCKVCNMDLEPKPTAKADKGKEYYTCPMHSEVKQDKPGSCPICGMNLVKKTEQTEGSENEYGIIANPVNVSVLSNVKAIKPVNKSVPIVIKSSGYITYDTRRIYNISARISGRIEELNIKYSYQPVKAGQALFQIFSHDLLSAQQDYLFLKNNDYDNKELISAARKRLLLLGMTESQINSIKSEGHVHPTTTVFSPYTGYVIEKSPEDNSASDRGTMGDSPMGNNSNSAANMNESNQSLTLREGAYVNNGQVVFKVVNADVVWGIFEVYSSHLPSLKVNQPVHIKVENTDEMVMGKIDFIEPTYKEETGTVRFRVYLSNKNQNLKIGNLLSGEIEAGIRSGLWIPQNAMYDLGRDKIVFVKKGEIYQTRKIEIGAVSGNDVQIVSGLEENEEIAENAQFMIDSESFVKVSK